jgi:hypothetical protein
VLSTTSTTLSGVVVAYSRALPYHDATSLARSLLGESISLCGLASVNQLAQLGSTPQTGVTTPQRGK